MYTRTLKAPKRATLLLGPRGTGKSTWAKTLFPDAYRIDLLHSNEMLRLQKDPSQLRLEVQALPKSQWILIDEIQKVPQLLDEVHGLIENDGYKRFLLTGSSARKLRRGGTNLLAGRAGISHLFPLTSEETNYAIPPSQILRFGLLPTSVIARNDADREEYLKSYVETYLSEEIRAEGLVREVGSFARFLEVASLVAGQKTNVLGLSRDSGVSRDTVRSYLEILEDTLIGTWLPAYRPRAKVKEVALPKFYWFDPGVLFAAYGGFQQPIPSDWKGVLLEHWIFHELSAYSNYEKVRGSLGYWATPTGSEIDFLWWYGENFVGIEVKASSEFSTRFLNGIHSFAEKRKLKRSFVVYLGKKELKSGKTWVLPVMSFLKRLHSGEVIEN